MFTKNNIRFIRLFCLLLIFFFSINTALSYDFAGGTGEPNNPYRIATADQLVSIGVDPNLSSMSFILVADINLSDMLFTKAVIPKYSGIFDGNDLSIRNLTIEIDRGTYIGLFGQLDDEAEVMNLGIDNVNIFSSDGYYSGGNIGGLVGYNSKGTITNCHCSGYVSGGGNIGGLARYNWGTITNCHFTGYISGVQNIGGLLGWNSGRITNCYSNCVIAGEFNVGGLIGVSERYNIINCYSNSIVSGLTDVDHRRRNIFSIGGLIGLSASNINKCYSTGTVTSLGSAAGGLIGSGERGYINNSFSTAVVISDANYVGGLIGFNDVEYGGIKVNNCFWDMEASGQTDSDGGTGLTTSQMKDIRTFLDAGWDFIDESENGLYETWQMPVDGNYPILSIFNGYKNPELTGQGTIYDPYLIYSAKELCSVFDDPQACYKLVEDINLASITWSMALIPEFSGVFDGNNLTIRNLTIDAVDDVGLFGLLYRVEIKNLGIEDVNIIGDNYIGALAGKNEIIDYYKLDGISVLNCYSSGIINGIDYVGGLIGKGYGSLTDCYNSTSVKGIDFIGGLLGYGCMNMSRCYNIGQITGSGRRIGGLFGDKDGETITINECYNNGTIAGGAYVGGLAGAGHYGFIISNCYNTGEVSGENVIGGLIGTSFNSGSIMNSYSAGVIISDGNDIGGLTGKDSKYIFDSFWDMETSGMTENDGGTGLTTEQMVDI